MRERAVGQRATNRAVQGGWRLMAVVAAVGVLAAGCGGSADESDESADQPVVNANGLPAPLGPPDVEGPPTPGGILLFGLEAAPGGLNPSGVLNLSGQTIASAIYDSLAVVNDAGEVEPHLAESIEPNAELTEWTIVLRSGVRFHNGEPLDAEALKINVDFWMSSLVTQGGLSPIESYEVVDDLTLLVSMDRPWASFPYRLTTQTGYVAAPGFLQDAVTIGPSLAAIGTGPFVYDSDDLGRSFTVSRNDDYWAPDLPHLDAIRFEFVSDPLERLSALNRGDLDLIHGYHPALVDGVRRKAAAGDLKVVENGTGEEDVVAINTQSPPFDDLLARQALAHATDAAAWRALAEPDGGDVRGPFAPGQLGFSTDDDFPEFDLERARRAAAEYEALTGSPITTELLTTDRLIDQQLADLLVEQWAAAGITATVRRAPSASLIVDVVSGNFQLVTWRNFGSIDPDADYLWWHSSGVQPEAISTNVSQYASEAIDTALDTARGTGDLATRDASYQTVARELNRGVAQVWLGRPTWVLAADPQVQGLAAGQVTMATLGAKPWLATLWLS